MEKKEYVKPELEMIETPDKDVLDVSFDKNWTGRGDEDFDLGWFD